MKFHFPSQRPRSPERRGHTTHIPLDTTALRDRTKRVAIKADTERLRLLAPNAHICTCHPSRLDGL